MIDAMVIQIRLGDRVDHTPEQIDTDSLHRSWSGYDPSVSDEVLWEHNRGRWSLGESRLAEEEYVTFVHGGRVVAAYALDGHERVSDPGPRGTKIALIGRPLSPTDAVRQRLVGTAVVHKGRNAVNYVADQPGDTSTGGEVEQRAFLLTWNPDNWEWPDFDERVRDMQGDRMSVDRWSTGGTKSGIYDGELVFLLRQGKRGRGIVGCGRAVDVYGDSGDDVELIYTDAHWDGSGATANYVDVEWDRLVVPEDSLPTDELQERFPEQNWTPMASGTRIRPELVEDLAAAWSAHVGETRNRGGGQGFITDAARRRAIEDAAQEWLMEHYRDRGWTVRDTRYAGPYDAVATKAGQTIYLEAKGTQGSGDAVFVTRGEVEHARRHAGHCVIGIWSGMRFTPDGRIDDQQGETLIMPFDPDLGALTPLQYRWEFRAEE